MITSKFAKGVRVLHKDCKCIGTVSAVQTISANRRNVLVFDVKWDEPLFSQPLKLKDEKGSRKEGYQSAELVVLELSSRQKQLIKSLQSRKDKTLTDAERRTVATQLLYDPAAQQLADEIHSLVAKFRVKAKCMYCKTPYDYNALIGDCNHGACPRRSCFLRRMRELM